MENKINGKTVVIDGKVLPIVFVTRTTKTGKVFCKAWAEERIEGTKRVKLHKIDNRKVASARRADRKEADKDKNSLLGKEDKARIKRIAAIANTTPESIPVGIDKDTFVLSEALDAITAESQAVVDPEIEVISGLKMSLIMKEYHAIPAKDKKEGRGNIKIIEQNEDFILVEKDGMKYKRIY